MNSGIKKIMLGVIAFIILIFAIFKQRSPVMPPKGYFEQTNEDADKNLQYVKDNYEVDTDRDAKVRDEARRLGVSEEFINKNLTH